jgi:hypothetical protein
MRVIKSLLALSCSISLFGQGSAAGLGKGEGEVDIVAWPGYIERGESNKSYDWSRTSRRRPAARSTSRPQAHPTKWLR